MNPTLLLLSQMYLSWVNLDKSGTSVSCLQEEEKQNYKVEAMTLDSKVFLGLLGWLALLIGNYIFYVKIFLLSAY